MANLCRAAVENLRNILLAPEGLYPVAYGIAVRDKILPSRISDPQVILRHVEPELADGSTDEQYPAVYLYCDRLENRLERKFTRFSGRVVVVADCRVSGETVESIDGDAERLLEAVMTVLSEKQGQWTPELAFGGHFNVRIRPVEAGGTHFRQTGQIEIELIAHA